MFWQRCGKFLKRLGPIVPLASWANFLLPSVASGASLLYFYCGFVGVTAYLCFVHPRSLAEKLADQIYTRDSLQNRYKQINLYLDAFFMGLITFSLACLLTIMVFRVPAMPLYDLILSGEPLNLPMSLISMVSICTAVLRYQQKSHGLHHKMLAFQLYSEQSPKRAQVLNPMVPLLSLMKFRLIRQCCDALVVFYNIFFVVFSLAMLFFRAQIASLLQAYFVWKMLGISSLLTIRIAYANQKLSSDYLCEKIASIAHVSWDEDHRVFVDLSSDAGPERSSTP